MKFLKFLKPLNYWLLPSSASTQLNSTQRQLEAEVSLISIWSSHPPTRPPTHPPRTVVSKTSSGLLLLNFKTSFRLIQYYFKTTLTLILRGEGKYAPQFFKRTTNSMSAISQLLLTRFWPNFKNRFLGQSWTDFNCYGDICSGNICPGNICQYQEYLSWYWLDFDQTLKVGSGDHL